MDVLFKGAGETDCYQRKLKLDFFISVCCFYFIPCGRTAERENVCI